jgi:hypothetical protein
MLCFLEGKVVKSFGIILHWEAPSIGICVLLTYTTIGLLLNTYFCHY